MVRYLFASSGLGRFLIRRSSISSAAKGGTLSSYCWVMMIIHFLQTRVPAVLPCLHKMYEGEPQISAEGVDTAFFTDIELKNRNFGANNMETLGGLFFRFFRRFAIEFDYETTVVSVRTGEFLRKSDKGWDVEMARHNNFLAVEEPFNPTRNLANSADFYSVVGLREEFRRAFNILLTGGTLEAVNGRYIFPGDSPQPNDTDMQLHLQLAGSLFPGKGYRNPPTPKKPVPAGIVTNGTSSNAPAPAAAVSAPASPTAQVWVPPSPVKMPQSPAKKADFTSNPSTATLEPGSENHSRSSSVPGMEFAVGKDGVPFVVQANPYHHIKYRFGPPTDFQGPYMLGPDFAVMGQTPYEMAAYYQSAAAYGSSAARRHSSVDRMSRTSNAQMSKALRAQAMSETSSPKWRAGEANGTRSASGNDSGSKRGPATASEASDAGSSPPPSSSLMGASIGSLADVIEIVLPPAATRRASEEPSTSPSIDSASSDTSSVSSILDSNVASSLFSRTPSPPPEKPIVAVDVPRIPIPPADTQPQKQKKKTLLWSNSGVKASTDMVMGAEDLFAPKKPEKEKGLRSDGKDRGGREKRKVSGSSSTSNGRAASSSTSNGKPATNGTSGSKTTSSTAAEREKDSTRPKQKSATFGGGSSASNNSFASLDSKTSQPARDSGPGKEPVVRAMSWASVVATKTSSGKD